MTTSQLDKFDNILQEILRECMNPQFEQWELLDTLGKSSFYRRLHSSGLYEWGSYVHQENVEPGKLVDMALDKAYIKVWHPNVAEASEIIVNGKSLLYFQMILPFPMANRDYVLETERGRMNIDGREVQTVKFQAVDGVYPERAGVVRVTDFCQVICVMVDIENPSHATCCSYVYQDPKGYIPKMVVNYVVKFHVKKAVQEMKTAYDNYDDWLLQRNMNKAIQ